jgi:CPA2 family monovalent cation:H+ antiporter-2
MIARAVDRNHVHDLWFAGCRDIIREYYDSSLRMGRSALKVMGAGAPQAEAVVAAAVYDPNIPAYENEAFIARINEMREERTEMLRQKMLVALRAE